MKQSFIVKMRRNWRGILGGTLFCVLVVTSILAPWLAAYDPLHMSLAECNQAPGLAANALGNLHLLGTDQLGRDLLTRVLYGGRVSLSLGLVAVLLAGLLGVLLGMVAGYFGGWVDTVIMRLADIQLAVPSILLAIVMVAVMGPSLVSIVLVLAVTGWVQYARVVRSNVLIIKAMEYIDAARCLGIPRWRILLRHIFPNVFYSVIIIASLQMARMILMEAALSFLGLSVNISTPTWGNMISEGRDFITKAPWLCTVPGVFIMLTIISVNLFGDWMRDFMDPKLKF